MPALFYAADCTYLDGQIMRHQDTSRGVVHAYANRIVRDGEPMFEVSADGIVRASPEQAWQVLTDYEGLPRFVPDLVSVRLLSRSGGVARIAQESRTGLLFLSQTIRMVLHIEEQPMSAIEVALVEGDMRRYEARWEITAAPAGEAGTCIAFSAVVEPLFYVPPVLGRGFVQVSVQHTVEAVVAEIERRSMAAG